VKLTEVGGGEVVVPGVDLLEHLEGQDRIKALLLRPRPDDLFILLLLL
jgi:hypothetical protein